MACKNGVSEIVYDNIDRLIEGIDHAE